MDDVIFIGDRQDASLFRDAGIPSYAPALGQLAERVLAERARCRVLAMTDGTFQALPETLARELREGDWPRLAIVPETRSGIERRHILDLLGGSMSVIGSAYA
jgi:vacuolar-type H+-ATPase subunit F/Vma7